MDPEFCKGGLLKKDLVRLRTAKREADHQNTVDWYRIAGYADPGRVATGARRKGRA